MGKLLASLVIAYSDSNLLLGIGLNPIGVVDLLLSYQYGPLGTGGLGIRIGFKMGW